MMQKLVEHKMEKQAFMFNGNGCIGLEVACNKELTEAKYIRAKINKSKSIEVKPLAQSDEKRLGDHRVDVINKESSINATFLRTLDFNAIDLVTGDSQIFDADVGEQVINIGSG